MSEYRPTPPTAEQRAELRALLEELSDATDELVTAVEGLALSDEEIMDGLTAIGRCYECGSQNHEGSAHE